VPVSTCPVSHSSPPVLVGASQDLTPEHIPHASSTTRVVQQLGGSFGTAVLAVLLQRGGGTDLAFAHTFAWSTAFTVVAGGVGLCLPARVAVVQPAS
jgi:hypothetical protein